jgi:beta-glucosidase
MKLIFPENFKFGTSTAAYQIETAFDHDWQGLRARDGNIFGRTTDHEKRYSEDIAIIASLAPNYRMSLMWSRLQRAPLASFDEQTKNEYHTLLQKLRERGVDIMMVLHHFANPIWFAKLGGWEKSDNINLWVDFAKKLVDEYGRYVSSWNTFNEPNLYTSLAYIAKEFPPFKSNLLTAKKVINNIAVAHDRMYDYIKSKYPQTSVGISHNCTVFEPENLMGRIPAKVFDWLFMEYPPGLFRQTDFFGMSYYARIGFDPLPITYLKTPEKINVLNKVHDDMWEYYPQGLDKCINRYWERFRKPIIITENGICTTDDSRRVNAINDYLRIIHKNITKGIPVDGYYHWSTWDNFEWSLGPTFNFGLYSCDADTKERIKKPSADLFSSVAFTRQLATYE